MDKMRLIPPQGGLNVTTAPDSCLYGTKEQRVPKLAPCPPPETLNHPHGAAVGIFNDQYYHHQPRLPNQTLPFAAGAESHWHCRTEEDAKALGWANFSLEEPQMSALNWV